MTKLELVPRVKEALISLNLNDSFTPGAFPALVSWVQQELPNIYDSNALEEAVRGIAEVARKEKDTRKADQSKTGRKQIQKARAKRKKPVAEKPAPVPKSKKA